MPPFGPISRIDLIRALRQAGFDGPYSGGKHPFMLKGDLTLTIPNPHHSDIGRELLAQLFGKRASLGRIGNGSVNTKLFADDLENFPADFPFPAGKRRDNFTLRIEYFDRSFRGIDRFRAVDDDQIAVFPLQLLHRPAMSVFGLQSEGHHPLMCFDRA